MSISVAHPTDSSPAPSSPDGGQGRVRNPNDVGFIAMQAGCVPFWHGKPAVAKTSTVEQFARYAERHLHIVRGQTDEPVDILGCLTKSEIAGRPAQGYLPADWVVRASLEPEKWIIFFDELTCVDEATQSALLQPIGERRCRTIPLSSKLWMCAAGNPPEIAANGSPIPSPMVSRLVHLDWKIDLDFWQRGLANNHNWEEQQYFTLLQPGWETEFRPVACRIVNDFLQRIPHLREAYPDDMDKQLSPYPVPRTWTIFTVGFAALLSVDASDRDVGELLTGCVGGAAAEEFMAWYTHRDLPDADAFLADALKRQTYDDLVLPHLPRADHVLIFASALASAAERCGLDNPKVWETCVAVLSMLGVQRGRDMTLPALKRVVPCMPEGAVAPDVYMAEYASMQWRIANSLRQEETQDRQVEDPEISAVR